VIRIDDREIKSGVINEFEKLKILFNVERLEVGDYIIDNHIFIERKTTSDFINSLNDGRLFGQVARLRLGNKRAILIIEGEKLPGYKRVRGALCSISTQWYMPVLRSINIEGTVWLMRQMQHYSEYKTVSAHYYEHKKRRNSITVQERMLIQMAHVGPHIVNELLTKFGTIKRIINATDEELLEISGIGEKLINQIKRL